MRVFSVGSGLTTQAVRVTRVPVAHGLEATLQSLRGVGVFNELFLSCVIPASDADPVLSSSQDPADDPMDVEGKPEVAHDSTWRGGGVRREDGVGSWPPPNPWLDVPAHDDCITVELSVSPPHSLTAQAPRPDGGGLISLVVDVSSSGEVAARVFGHPAVSNEYATALVTRSRHVPMTLSLLLGNHR
mmetsp:Transcript_43514/g.102353  ORF Transcript_43514/g.102353 Transcript_43514/m.102353 type:complete len:187 (+) Transcript_43514:444-1004(+)